MYGLMFGQNPAAAVILATLKLTRSDVGRFRDAFVADGQIAVYTRNGGGNRECVHAESPEYGDADCRSEPFEKTVREYVRRPGSSLDCCRGGATYIGREPEHDHATGRDVVETWYRCLAPDSAECACYGCAISYRLPAHPLYVRDADDDFDCTYATVYFRFPEDYAAGLAAMDSGEAWDPDARWLELIERLKS